MKLHTYNINKIYQLIAIAKTQLGLSDEHHRAVLESFGAVEKNGRISATTLPKHKLIEVLELYIERGFVIRSGAKSKTTNSANERGYTNKYRYILYILRQIDKEVSYADKMAKTMFRVDKALWLNHGQQSLVIKGLRKHAEKNGVIL